MSDNDPHTFAGRFTRTSLRELEGTGRWPRDVALWLVHVATAPDHVAGMSALLDKVERQRAARYRMPADVARFVSTRYALRCLLGKRIGMEPSVLRFNAGPQGKPALPDLPDLSFNVSHAGGHALIAISSHRTVGVDIEQVEPAFDWRPIVDLVCNVHEKQMIAGADPVQQQRLFMRCWTAKEALVKTIGTGIGDGLSEIGVDPLAMGEQRPAPPREGEGQGIAGLRFHWLEEIDGYVGCVAFDDIAR